MSNANKTTNQGFLLVFVKHFLAVFRMLCFGITCKWVLFAIFLLAYIDHCNAYNKLVNTRIVKTDYILTFMFHFGKGVTFFGVFVICRLNCFFRGTNDHSTQRVERLV